jgi:multicomponent Na+:H+ antiporter subunit G
MEITIENILALLSNIFLLAGSFFIVTSAIGLVRMKDFFTRTHPAGINDSLSLPLILIGILLKLEPGLVMGKLIVIIIFSVVTTSTASHALIKAAIHETDPAGKNDKNFRKKL